MSAVSSLFHIVINTLRRELTIPDDESEQLYRICLVNRTESQLPPVAH